MIYYNYSVGNCSYFTHEICCERFWADIEGEQKNYNNGMDCRGVNSLLHRHSCTPDHDPWRVQKFNFCYCLQVFCNYVVYNGNFNFVNWSKNVYYCNKILPFSKNGSGCDVLSGNCIVNTCIYSMLTRNFHIIGI
jgi:hypothetical protein